ncbi:MAG: cyclase family protein [Chitinophagales bacterium]|nr:cyclase family protein [Chitinophagales bacterium]
MRVTFPIGKDIFQVNLLAPIDLSIPLDPARSLPNAWHAQPFSAEPVIAGSFIGSVAQGGSVNFMNVSLNPHGNGTHTECVGHISNTTLTINQCLQRFFFVAQLISVEPLLQVNGDKVITKAQVEALLVDNKAEALIVRTLPNGVNKLSAQYSGANPPYFAPDALDLLQQLGVWHLLTDLPSVDKEDDGGLLAAHKAFWQYPHQTREAATITEMVYVPNEVIDGCYLLNLQIASFELDASPSKPVIYRLEKV